METKKYIVRENPLSLLLLTFCAVFSLVLYCEGSGKLFYLTGFAVAAVCVLAWKLWRGWNSVVIDAGGITVCRPRPRLYRWSEIESCHYSYAYSLSLALYPRTLIITLNHADSTADRGNDVVVIMGLTNYFYLPARLKQAIGSYGVFDEDATLKQTRHRGLYVFLTVLLTILAIVGISILQS